MAKKIIEAQQEVEKITKLPIDKLDKKTFGYTKDDNCLAKSDWEHRSRQGEVKSRNKKGGTNHKLMANLCLVLIYQYWDFLRCKFKKKNDKIIDSDLMGDIRYLRNSILKHRGIGSSEMSKCKILKWFKEKDLIDIDERKFEIIVKKIKTEIPIINNEYFS